MRQLLKRLASLRLTLAILLILAAVGALGTFNLLPQRQEPDFYLQTYGGAGQVFLFLGLDSFHTSFLYRLLFVVLGVNLTACGVRRSLAGFRDFSGKGQAAESVPLDAGRDEVEKRLRSAGFRVASPTPLRARRRAWAFLGFPLVHLAPIPLLLGALWGSVGGTVATQNVYVGSLAETMYDWSLRKDVNLPFAMALEDFNLTYYPGLVLQVKAIASEGAAIEFTLREGETAAVPGAGYSARIEKFDPKTGDIVYRILKEDRTWGPYSRGNEEGAPLRLRPLAYKDEGGGGVKRAEARVRFFDPSRREIGTAVVAVNQPASVNGYRIYLTAWGDDDEGRAFAGFQATRDPGEWLLWIASLALTLGVIVMLFAEGAWVAERDGRLEGRCSRDRRRFAEFLREIAKGENETPPAPGLGGREEGREP